MSGKRAKFLRQQQETPVKPEMGNPISVETIQLQDALHFSCSFSFDIKTGRNNFDQLAELVDNEMNQSRQLVLEKIANKLGVKVNFDN